MKGINSDYLLNFRHEAPMLNESYFPKDVFGSMSQLREMEGYKYPHLQIRNLTYSKGNTRLLDRIDLEARGGELIAVLATNGKII